MTDTLPDTIGLVLAGGQARRMGGGDKAFLTVGGVKILDRALGCLRPHCAAVILNANGDPARFDTWRLPVMPDSVPGFAGPLAGILAGLDWVAAHQPEIKWMVSVPGDCPFLPDDLVARLHDARNVQGKPLAAAQSGARRHPVCGLWPLHLRDDLRRALEDEGMHKVEGWTARYGIAHAVWPDVPFDPFFNVNTPEDAARAEEIAKHFQIGVR